MTRQETFAFLKEKGFNPIPNGLVSEFVPGFIQGLRAEMGYESDVPDIKVTDNINEAVEAIDVMARRMQREMFAELCRVVVYTDPEQRDGKSIELLNGYEALAKYPNSWCSQYRTYTLDGSGFSKRILCVGSWMYVIEYSSSDWRSHNGENKQLSVVTRVQGERNRNMPYPTYAVDFVGDPMMAIDFEESPSLEPIKKYMSEEEINKEVKEFLEMMNNGQLQQPITCPN
jgi:hypothetical protein